MMHIKLIAFKEDTYHSVTSIYYLNLSEPKHQQLHMAIFTNEDLEILTCYNPTTHTYEEITTMFPKQHLTHLSAQIRSQTVSLKLSTTTRKVNLPSA